MDKFFYRLFWQTLIKGVLAVVIGWLGTALIYTFFVSVLQPVSAKVDYWVQMIAALLISLVTCFFLVFVKDNYDYHDALSYSVGKKWSKRVQNGKKLHWFWLELIMLPLLAVGVYLGYSLYQGHEATLLKFTEFFAEGKIDSGKATDFYWDNSMHVIKLVLTIFFLWQWWHVRGFAKEGRCRHCKAAFSLGFYQSIAPTTRHSSSISKKARTEVVGGRYSVTMDGDREVDRTRIGDIRETTYDYYRTNTTIYTSGSVCRCAFCGQTESKFSSTVSSTKTKL